MGIDLNIYAPVPCLVLQDLCLSVRSEAGIVKSSTAS